MFLALAASVVRVAGRAVGAGGVAVALTVESTLEVHSGLLFTFLV